MFRVRSGWLGVLGMAVALGLFQVTGCSESDGKDDDKVAESLLELGIDDGASEGASASARVTVDKETTLNLKTGAEVKIAAGSVTKEVLVTIERPADEKALEFVKSMDKKQKLGSAPYVITPHKQAFTKQVEVTLPVSAQVNTEKVQVVYLADEKDRDWKVIGKPEVSAGKAKIKVDHFSVLMLVEMEETATGRPDAGPGGVAFERPDAPAGSWTAVLFDKFQECGLIGQGGELSFGSEIPAPGSDDACELECVRTTDCAGLEQLLCGGSPPVTYQACAEACNAVTFTCVDGQTVDFNAKCDGHADCVDESDEIGCPAGTGFVCADGSSTWADDECDGYAGCADGSDELNCDGKQFTCADGSGTLSIDSVCDLFSDCADGSDEPARCLKLTCEPLPPQDSDDVSNGVITPGPADAGI